MIHNHSDVLRYLQQVDILSTLPDRFYIQDGKSVFLLLCGLLKLEPIQSIILHYQAFKTALVLA